MGVNSNEPSFTIIKGRFKASATSSFGLFIVFIDNVAKCVDRFDVVASHFSTVYENNVIMPWNELEDLVGKMKWKGEFATSLTHDIQSSFDDTFDASAGRLVDILNALRRSQINKVNSIFEEALARPTSDKGVKVETVVEVVSLSDIDDVKRMREQNDQGPVISTEAISNVTQGTDDTSGGSAVVLDVSLELSPVSGKQIMDLQVGEKILVKITEESGRGQYFIDLLNANVDGKLIPVPATVEKTTAGPKSYTVKVNIGPGIYGTAINEDNVKVKLYNPNGSMAGQIVQKSQADIPMTDPALLSKQEMKEEKNFSMIVFVIAGAAAFLVLLLILFMFF